MTSKEPEPAPTVGSHWADNKIWMLGRVVRITAIDGEYAEVVVTNEPRGDRGLVPGQRRSLSLIGKRYRIKLDRFRPFTRPRHGYLLPAKGPHDGLERVVEPSPETVGMPPSALLRLKYDNGWVVSGPDGQTVDFKPRRKGDGRAWAAADGSRYPSTRCTATIPTAGVRVEIGQTMITDGRTGMVGYDSHIMVDAWTASCGITADPPRYGPVSPIERCTLCVTCERDNPHIALAIRVNERAGFRILDDNRDEPRFAEERSALLNL
jgi:hypothetical protein